MNLVSVGGWVKLFFPTVPRKTEVGPVGAGARTVSWQRASARNPRLAVALTVIAGRVCAPVTTIVRASPAPVWSVRVVQR